MQRLVHFVHGIVHYASKLELNAYPHLALPNNQSVS